MITETDALRGLEILRGAGIAGLRDAQPAVWAVIINAAPITVTTRDGRVPVTDERGQVVRLDPRPEEVAPAATRMASLGVTLPQAADLAAAIQDRREGDRATRAALIQADAERHGPLLPEGPTLEAMAELAWRRAATAAVGAGATREQAVAHAWRAIGRTAPALPAAGDVLDGLTGPARTREILRRLKTTQNHPPLGAGAGQNPATAPRDHPGRFRPSESLTRNRPTGRTTS